MSFRLRLFLVAAALVSAVVALVVVAAGQRLHAQADAQLDARLCQEARRLAGGGAPPGDDGDALARDLQGKLQVATPEDLSYTIEPRDGRPATRWGRMPATTAAATAPEPSPRLAPDPAVFEACALDTRPDPRGDWRASRMDGPDAAATVAARIAGARAALDDALRATLWRLLPVALLAVAAGAWGLAAYSLRPVNRLREAMRAMHGRGLDRRLDGRGVDREFAELIAAYNRMLERLEASFRQASRFSSDAAHELRTPLTVLRGRLERARLGARDAAQEDEYTRLLDDVARLAAITRRLLLLSRADAGQLALQREPVDLGALLREVVEEARESVDDGRRVTLDAPSPLTVHADPVLLAQLVNNLASNAMRHGRRGGWIRIEARADAGVAAVLVANDCAPLDPAQRARFFERFFRAAPAVAGDVDGHGLGLSIAREIARAHGGDLVLEDSAADEVRLRLTLPVRPAR